MSNTPPLQAALDFALQARANILGKDQNSAIRLFAGFYEGCPEPALRPSNGLVADLYGRTLVLFDHSDKPETGEQNLQAAQEYLLEKLPWVDCAIWKRRTAQDQNLRRGVVTFGDTPAREVSEHGVRYALDLQMHQDASFYLDTRGLRQWLLGNAAGCRVLNTFAYTGSLGVAALAGGAAKVIQTDRNKAFLNLARQSGMLNRLDIGKMKLQAGDFFSQAARLKRSGALFDCVIVDPPFFSSTPKGRIDLVNESLQVINKVRPLIKDGGTLVAVNNSVFLSGADYLHSLELLCQDGYLSIEAFIPVPLDITGFPESILNPPPVDPAPFNHATKIALLRVRRK